jgi:hypothetical protein
MGYERLIVIFSFPQSPHLRACALKRFACLRVAASTEAGRASDVSPSISSFCSLFE